jgi:hypothetical protein
LNQSTFSWEEHPANLFPSQDSNVDSKIRAEASCLPTLQSLNVTGLDGLSGKMSPAFCHRTEDGILEPSSGRWETWGMGSHTECWTLNGSESPNDAAVSSLSDILETGELPQRFFLSEKACAGILRRAERNGRKLPPALKAALMNAVCSE